MSKRVKVSDLKVTDRELPLLVYVEPPQVPKWSTEEQKSPVLHISVRDGEKSYSKHYVDRYKITNCNHPFAWSSIYAESALDLDNYRLCRRCAPKGKTPETFEGKLAEYWRIRTERTAQRNEEKKRKEAQRQGEELLLAERLDEFAFGVLPTAGMPAPSFVGDPAHAIRVIYKGHIYEIRETS